MNKNSTGSCVTVEEVPAGNEIGVIWVPVDDGRLVGFAFDMDAAGTLANALEKARAYCAHERFGIAGEVERAAEKDCRLDRMHAPEFLDKFGGLPAAPGIFFDEGGSLGTAEETFKSEDAPKNAFNVHAQETMRAAARKSSLESAGVVAAVVVAFCILETAAPAFGLTLLAVALALVGVWHVCISVKKMTRAFYAKAVMPGFDACRFVTEKKEEDGEAE